MKAAVTLLSNRAALSPDWVAANALAAMQRPVELLLLVGLLTIYALVYALGASVLYPTLNVVGPTTLTSILGWSCYRIARQSPIAVWAPLFWFRLACAAYYGFGALVPHIVDEEAQQSIYAVYYFDQELNLKINIIYVTGITSALLFSRLFLFHSNRGAGIRVNLARAASGTPFFCLSFLLVGGVLRYGFSIPYNFGLTDTVLPGTVGTLSKMFYAGIFLLIVHGVRANRRLLPLAWILIGIEIVVSVASFAKTELLLILIFSFLGFMSRGASKTMMMLGASCVLLAFFTFQPLVGYGREELVKRYGEISGAGLGERWEIVQNYLEDGSESSTSLRSGGMSRLSYVNVTAFVIDRYDAGLPGDTLRTAPAVLVPRLIWPDKPIITQLGADLYVLVRGREGTSFGLGHFAEAYWNFGWWGILPSMALLGFLLSVFTRFSIKIMSQQNWLFLPVVFIGVNMGVRVDGHFVPDILGPAWMAISLAAVLTAVAVLMGGSLRLERRLSQRHFRGA